MAKRQIIQETAATPSDGGSISLAESLTTKMSFSNFHVWLVGETPLITHSWSFKARDEMLKKQTGAMKPGKTKRDPEQDFHDSLYEMGDSTFGFPAMGVKNCILSAAHKDKGIPRSTVQSSLWINSDMTRVRPALAGAVCDMPLLRIYGSSPEMREDMVKIGSGLNKTANLAYRGQFRFWAIRVTGMFNSTTMKQENLVYLLQDAGRSYGLGEWRNERKGPFGAFHLGNVAEQYAWEQFAAGKGPMPKYAEPERVAA